MKKRFNLINLAIFATVIMSVFTSCGDSEVFDEPVMFRTRAMGGMDTRSEFQYIMNNGYSEVSEWITTHEALLKVVFTWSPGLFSKSKLSAKVSWEDVNDESIDDPGNEDPYVYSYEESSKMNLRITNGPYIIDNGNSTRYLGVDVVGNIIQYRFNIHTFELDTDTLDVSNSFRANDPIIIDFN